MPADIREYLIDRFRSDAVTLRARATALERSRVPSPGPDAGVSRSMANACDDVAGLAELLPPAAPLRDIIAALQGILPELMKRASAVATPAIKSVYVGACTRVQELIAAETRAPSPNAGSANGSPIGPGNFTDEDDDEQ